MLRRAPLWALLMLCAAAPGGALAQSGLHAPLQPSNHALIITVSEYQRSPLPGVLNDRKLGQLQSSGSGSNGSTR